MMIIAPRSMEQLIEDGDTVVVASLEAVTQEIEWEFPTSALDPLAPTPLPDDPPWMWWITEYEAEVRDVLKAHGEIAQNARIPVRTTGKSPSSFVLNTEYLLILGENDFGPPGEAYIVQGGYLGAIPMSASTVQYVGGDAVSFAAGLSPAEFVEEVRGFLQR